MGATERKVMQTVSDVIDLTTAGDDPTTALYKAASNNKLTPDFVRRVAEAYNTSRVLHHFENSTSEKRSDHFPLADAQQVIDRMWPATNTKAASALPGRTTVAFSAPPNFNEVPRSPMVKLAHEPVNKAPEITLDRAFELVFEHRALVSSLAKRAHIDALQAKDEIIKAASDAATFFANKPADLFPRIEAGLLRLFGVEEQPVVDFVAAAVGTNVKRASAPADFPPFSIDSEPYTFFTRIKNALLKYAEATRRQASFTEEIATLAKAANVAQNLPVQMGIGYIAGQLQGLGARDSAPSQTFDFTPDLDDLEHDASRRSIQAKASLNTWMANDPVISQHSQEDVMQAFNDVVQAAPHIVNSPSVLRGWLARRLETGTLDPYEGTELLGTEAVLHKAR